MSLISEWEKGRIETIPANPYLVVVTLSPKCNLKCLHCYWSHNLAGKVAKQWGMVIEKIAASEAFVVYAGRVITKEGARFIAQYCEFTGRQIGIIDNGYTILKFPELLKYYCDINISIDGIKEDNDIQRQKVGAFNKAWTTVLELKRLGHSPVVASALSNISIRRWLDFEALLADNEIPVCTTPVWGLSETCKRNTGILFSEKELQHCFELLCGGISKLINLYDIAHVRVLAPLLKELCWHREETYLKAILPNETKVIYRPLSIVHLTEVDLLWDGSFAKIDEKGDLRPLTSNNEEKLAKANSLLLEEREVWSSIIT